MQSKMAVKDLDLHYGSFQALKQINIEIPEHQVTAFIGPSGCGKSTMGRTILRLIEKTDGEVLFNGEDVNSWDKKKLRDMRTKMQIIFQDPYSSLSPRLPVGEIIGEAVREHGLVSKEEYDAGQERIKKLKESASKSKKKRGKNKKSE